MQEIYTTAIVAIGLLVLGLLIQGDIMAQPYEEKQLTFAAKSHWLDNNDNFSADGRFLCYDTRETIGPGIEHSQTIEVFDFHRGKSIVVYKPEAALLGNTPAPGVGAVSFSFSSMEVAFIHGPPVSEVTERGPYGRSNRNGACVQLKETLEFRDNDWHMSANGTYAFHWLDKRDVETTRDTLPGAHRGGTHRHEYCRKGNRIGFTYDDHLLPNYDRTIGYMEPHPNAPPPASHYFAILVSVVPKGTSHPGEIEKAYGDSWVDPRGTMRAFIGKVRNKDGIGYEESLFVVDVPSDVDITSADSGNTKRFPSPPEGISIRRLTHSWASGIVRGSPDGKSIAYFGKDVEGRSQVFIINALGSDLSEQPEMRPRQVSFLEHGTESGLRWHPSGKWLICVSNDGIAKILVDDGPDFGKTIFLTPQGDGADRHAPVISPDGKRIAYNKRIATFDTQGHVLKNYAGEDFVQIFVIDVDT